MFYNNFLGHTVGGLSTFLLESFVLKFASFHFRNFIEKFYRV